MCLATLRFNSRSLGSVKLPFMVHIQLVHSQETVTNQIDIFINTVYLRYKVVFPFN